MFLFGNHQVNVKTGIEFVKVLISNIIHHNCQVTYGAKVWAQNTCSFFSSSETASESQKQLVRLRIFHSFLNMDSEILCQFLLGNNEGILERQFGQKSFSYILTI